MERRLLISPAKPGAQGFPDSLPEHEPGHPVVADQPPGDDGGADLHLRIHLWRPEPAFLSIVHSVRPDSVPLFYSRLAERDHLDYRQRPTGEARACTARG